MIRREPLIIPVKSSSYQESGLRPAFLLSEQTLQYQVTAADIRVDFKYV
jgi:hypothetical protein